MVREGVIRRWGSSIRTVAYDHRGHGRCRHRGHNHLTRWKRLRLRPSAILHAVAPVRPGAADRPFNGRHDHAALRARTQPEWSGRASSRARTGRHGRRRSLFARHRQGSARSGSILDSTAAATIQPASVASTSGRPGSVSTRSCGMPASRPYTSAPGSTTSHMRTGTEHHDRSEPSQIPPSASAPLRRNFLTLAVLGQIPVTVICGTEDKLTPLAHSTAITAAIAAARLVTVAGAGHLVVTQAPGCGRLGVERTHQSRRTSPAGRQMLRCG